MPSQAMVLPRSSMFRNPSSSSFTSPFSRPNPRFQYVEPGTITPDMRNIWLIVSKAWVPPPLPYRDYCRPYLSAEQSLVGYAHQPRTVEEAFHFGAHVGEIGRRPKDYRLGATDLFEAVIEDIRIHGCTWRLS